MLRFLGTPENPFARVPVMGAALALILVMGSIVISTHSLFAFFSIEGLLIVGGGVIAAAFLSYPPEEVNKALAVIKAMFKESRRDNDTLHRDMLEIITWARLLKDKGARALESSFGKEGVQDPFVKYALNMVVSGYQPEEIRGMMETAADAHYEKACVPVDVLESMTSHAPAFGMVGTLVGMVTMLCGLGDDYNMAAIGSSLGVAFLSTLYGVLSARMLYMPAAARLRQETDRARFRHQFIVEGMVLLASGKTPMYMHDRLNSFLCPEKRDYYNVFTKRSFQTVRPLRASA